MLIIKVNPVISIILYYYQELCIQFSNSDLTNKIWIDIYRKKLMLKISKYFEYYTKYGKQNKHRMGISIKASTVICFFLNLQLHEKSSECPML